MIFNHKEMSNQVLDRLSKLQELPKSGFLSGGAVANTILSIIDNKEYPINDLDVFTVDEMLGDSVSNAPTRADDEVVYQDRYENTITSPNLENSYKIKSTSLDGLINYVYVYFRKSISNDKDYMKILKSFDINCCKVGIDLSNGNMIIDQDFIDFVISRQLKCTTPVTPAHSVIRLIKKRDDLNAYLDKESEFKFLSQFYHFNEHVFSCRVNISFFFGQKYKDLYFKYESEIKEYFQLKSYSQCFIERHQVYVKNEIKKGGTWWNINSFIEPEVMERWNKKRVFTIVPTKFVELDDEVNQYLKNQYKYNPIYVKRLWNLLYKQNKKQKDKALKILSNDITHTFIMKNDEFHLCDFNDKNIEYFSKFIKNNPTIENLILMSKLNFQESEKMIYIIKKFFPQEIEMLSNILCKQILNEEVDCSKLIDKEYIINKYSEVKKVLSVPYGDYLNLSDFDFKNEVKELNSEFDLLWGGKYMHNCLGTNGFGERISSKKIKIFIISDSDNRTAVLLNNNNDGIYSISQIYGVSNSPANKKHRLISQYLVEYLNYKHYLLESQKRISLFEEIKNNIVSSINSIDSTTIDDTNHINVNGVDAAWWVDF